MGTLTCIGESLWNGSDCVDVASNHNVMVMDRALVVCHADHGQCERPDGGGVTGNLDRLESKVGALNGAVTRGFETLGTAVGSVGTNVNRGFERVEGEFNYVNRHMDRHRRQIIGRVTGEDVPEEHVHEGLDNEEETGR